LSGANRSGVAAGTTPNHHKIVCWHYDFILAKVGCILASRRKAREQQRAKLWLEMTIEWNKRKAAANLKKHRVAFEDAATVFLDPLAVTFPDPDQLMG
jgi:hypothetical protein